MPADEFPRPTSDRRPDWQLPVGVDRPLWEYLQSSSIADDYDDYFADTNLLKLDQKFVLDRFTVPGRLVDLGCGTGRLLIPFAERGFEVLGIDLSPNMIRVCEKKRSHARLPITLMQANICRLADLADGTFDYAVSMFSTLGLIVGRDERRQALREAWRILRPGGSFAFHVHNRLYNLFNPPGRRWLIADTLRRMVGVTDAGDRVQKQYRGIPNLRIHLFSAREIRKELSHAGFQLVEMIPLAPDRNSQLFRPKLLGGIQANGWLILARKPGIP